jgi:hypothetical protein
MLAGLAVYQHYVLPHPLNSSKSLSLSSTGQTPTQSKEYYTNSKGQRWTIDPVADFTVSSGAGAKISFLEGKIDPLKVIPGDTQHMRIVIQGASGISSVIAQIETDHGTTTVELHKTGNALAKDLNPNYYTYVVKGDTLQALSPQEAVAYRDRAIKADASSSLVSPALASSGEREIWEGSWIVKDTSLRTYHTTFLATDSEGNQDNLVLAWSDPNCNLPTGITAGTNYSSTDTACSISSVYGVDGGGITLATSSSATTHISVMSGGVLALNSGQTIKILTCGSVTPCNSGTITILSGGFIRFGYYLYYTDADQDGYPASNGGIATISTSTSFGDGNGFLQINGTWERRGIANSDTSVATASSTVNGSTYSAQALAPSPKTVAALNQDTRPSLWQFLVPAAHALLPMACTGDSGYPCYRSYSGCAACGSYTTSGTTAVVTASSAFTSKAVLYSGFNFSSSTTPYIPPYAKITGISVTLNITKSVSTSGAKAYALIAYNDPTNGWTVVNDSTSSSETYTGIDSSGTFNATIGSTSSYLWDAYFGADSGTGPIYGPRFGVYTMVSSPSAATININSITINVGYSIVGLKTAVDCADGDARANPGQAGYFTTPIQWFGVDATTTAEYTGGAAAVSSHYYDFNCSNSTDKGLATSIGSCGTGARNDQGPLWALVNTAYAMPYNPSGSTSASTAGWSTAAPGCGSSGSYFYYCVSNSPVYSTLTMMCK